MARWRAVNSSCMGTSVVRPLAVAHGGYSRRGEEGEQTDGAAKADTTARERNEQLAGRFKQALNEHTSGKPERSAVGSQLPCISTLSSICMTKPPRLGKLERFSRGCEPTAHRELRNVIRPTPHHPPECLREPTAAA